MIWEQTNWTESYNSWEISTACKFRVFLTEQWTVTTNTKVKYHEI
jgi:hypothetical protein